MMAYVSSNFSTLCSFDNFPHFYVGNVAGVFSASCAPVSRCLPPGQPEGLWSVYSHTLPRAEKSGSNFLPAVPGGKFVGVYCGRFMAIYYAAELYANRCLDSLVK